MCMIQKKKKKSVNINKTTIMVFLGGKVRNFPMFKYGSSTIEVVSKYVYLGVTMMYCNKNTKVMKKTRWIKQEKQIFSTN